jgi:hypothetical protein
MREPMSPLDQRGVAKVGLRTANHPIVARKPAALAAACMLCVVAPSALADTKVAVVILRQSLKRKRAAHGPRSRNCSTATAGPQEGASSWNEAKRNWKAIQCYLGKRSRKEGQRSPSEPKPPSWISARCPEKEGELSAHLKSSASFVSWPPAGYDVALRREVSFFSHGSDITDRVIQLYNQTNKPTDAKSDAKDKKQPTPKPAVSK